MRELNLVKNKKGQWCFLHEGKKYSLAPPDIINYVINPNVYSVDSLTKEVVKQKKITNDSLQLEYSEEYIPNADLKILFTENKFDGLMFEIENLNISVSSSKVWVCSYFFYFFKTTPKFLYLKLS